MSERLYRRPKNPVTYLLRQVINNRQIAEWEILCGKKRFGQVWSLHWDLGTWSYARRIGLTDGYFNSFVNKYYEDNGYKPIGLDVGSSTGALRQLQIPGIAISMGEPRSKERQEADAQDGLRLVAGDVLLSSTWEEKLRKQMEFSGIQSFQLIMAFPQGGIQYITDNPAVHFGILQRMWSVLDPNGGLLAAQMTLHKFVLSSLPLIHKKKWIDFLNTVDGIEAKVFGDPHSFRNGGIQLIRHPQAPERLPLNFSLKEEDLRNSRRYKTILMKSNIKWLQSLKR